MSNSKMSQVIKSVLELTDSVLGKPATRGQVIQVIELIESFDAPVKPAAKEQMATATKTKPKDVKKVNKTKAKALRRPYTSPKVVVKWSELNWWIDEVLDGKSHLISYADLGAILPIQQMNAQAIETKLRKEARIRGYKTVKIQFNRKLSNVSVHATR